jgi:hypothetical protein
MGNVYDSVLVNLILDEMRECVESNNFVVKTTDKNKAFISEYALSREMQRDMLLGIAVEDYFNSSESRNFPGKYVHEFCPTYDLHTFNGEQQSVSTYVKFEVEYEADAEKQTVVISLHWAERQVHFPLTRNG